MRIEPHPHMKFQVRAIPGKSGDVYKFLTAANQYTAPGNPVEMVFRDVLFSRRPPEPAPDPELEPFAPVPVPEPDVPPVLEPDAEIF